MTASPPDLKPPVLKVLTWVGYLPPGIADKLFSETGWTIEETPYPSNREFPQVLADRGPFDLIIAPQDRIQELIESKFLAPLNLKGIPEAKEIRPEVLEKMTFDPKQTYSLPFALTAPVLMIPLGDLCRCWTQIKALDSLVFQGRVQVPDEARLALGLGLVALGFEPDTSKEGEIRKAGAWVKSRMGKIPLGVQKLDMLKTSQSRAFYGYKDPMETPPGDFAVMYTVGIPLYMDCFAIPKASPHQTLSQKLINLLLKKGEYVKIMAQMGFPYILKGLENKTAGLPPFTELLALELEKPQPQAIHELYEKIWNEVRSQP